MPEDAGWPEGFFRQARRIFAGILCVLQENSTRHGGKRPGQTAFEVVNTGSKFTAGAALRRSKSPARQGGRSPSGRGLRLRRQALSKDFPGCRAHWPKPEPGNLPAVRPTPLRPPGRPRTEASPPRPGSSAMPPASRWSRTASNTLDSSAIPPVHTVSMNRDRLIMSGKFCVRFHSSGAFAASTTAQSSV